MSDGVTPEEMITVAGKSALGGVYELGYAKGHASGVQQERAMITQAKWAWVAGAGFLTGLLYREILSGLHFYLNN